MNHLTFRITGRQLRGLGLYVLLLAGVAVLLAVLAAVSGGGWGSTPGWWAFGAGFGALVGLWALVMYARAFTECTPTGIHTRGLAGTRDCRWGEVADIVPRPYRGTVIVSVITTYGSRFWLGAPVAGGVMGDPEFGAKLAQIQQYWRSVVTRADDATLMASSAVGEAPPRRVPPDVPDASADMGSPDWLPAMPPVHVRRRSVSAWNVFSNVCFTLAALAAVGVLVMAPWALGPAIRAAHGNGTPGMFTAQEQQCSRVGCNWLGMFRSEHGTVLHDADYVDRAPPGTHSGSSFPALWPGGSNDVYAAHGSTGWIQIVLAEVVAGVGLAALVWYGPIRYLRKRKRHGRSIQP